MKTNRIEIKRVGGAEFSRRRRVITFRLCDPLANGGVHIKVFRDRGLPESRGLLLRNDEWCLPADGPGGQPGIQAQGGLESQATCENPSLESEQDQKVNI